MNCRSRRAGPTQRSESDRSASGLITRRSAVQIRPPPPSSERYPRPLPTEGPHRVCSHVPRRLPPLRTQDQEVRRQSADNHLGVPRREHGRGVDGPEGVGVSQAYRADEFLQSGVVDRDADQGDRSAGPRAAGSSSAIRAGSTALPCRPRARGRRCRARTPPSRGAGPRSGPGPCRMPPPRRTRPCARGSRGWRRRSRNATAKVTASRAATVAPRILRPRAVRATRRVHRPTVVIARTAIPPAATSSSPLMAWRRLLRRARPGRRPAGSPRPGTRCYPAPRRGDRRRRPSRRN